MIGLEGIIGGAIDTVADKFFADKSEKMAFKLKSMELQQAGALEPAKLKLSAIIAEANSEDPWTSRARPSFLYVMYAMILFSIPFGVLFLIAPEAAAGLSEGCKMWLDSVPDALWNVFGVGYLGYTGARSFFDKKHGK